VEDNSGSAEEIKGCMEGAPVGSVVVLTTSTRALVVSDTTRPKGQWKVKVLLCIQSPSTTDSATAGEDLTWHSVGCEQPGICEWDMFVD
jgi:hypothetical protein